MPTTPVLSSVRTWKAEYVIGGDVVWRTEGMGGAREVYSQKQRTISYDGTDYEAN